MKIEPEVTLPPEGEGRLCYKCGDEVGGTSAACTAKGCGANCGEGEGYEVSVAKPGFLILNYR